MVPFICLNLPSFPARSLAQIRRGLTFFVCIVRFYLPACPGKALDRYQQMEAMSHDSKPHGDLLQCKLPSLAWVARYKFMDFWFSRLALLLLRPGERRRRRHDGPGNIIKTFPGLCGNKTWIKTTKSAISWAISHQIKVWVRASSFGRQKFGLASCTVEVCV